MTKRKEMWNFDEVSTRNCFNAKVHNDIVTCKYNEHLKLMEKNVINFGRLLAPCKGCTEFNKEWRGKR